MDRRINHLYIPTPIRHIGTTAVWGDRDYQRGSSTSGNRGDHGTACNIDDSNGARIPRPYPQVELGPIWRDGQCIGARNLDGVNHRVSRYVNDMDVYVGSVIASLIHYIHVGPIGCRSYPTYDR